MRAPDAFSRGRGHGLLNAASIHDIKTYSALTCYILHTSFKTKKQFCIFAVCVRRLPLCEMKRVSGEIGEVGQRCW